MKDINLYTSEKIQARCIFYDVLNEIEGLCFDGELVSRIGGCDCPEKCEKYRRREEFKFVDRSGKR